MKKSSSLGVAAFAAIFVMTGCGGNGTTHLPSGRANYVGSATVATTTTESATVPATGGATVTTEAGTAVVPSGVAPAGTTYPSGTPMALIPINTGFRGSVPAGSQVTVNGVADSGGTVQTNGLLGVNLVLPVTEAGTSYTLRYPASTLDTSRVLNVQEMIFKGTFYLRTSPVRVISPVPFDIVGSLPNNGENAFGSFMNVTWGAGNVGRKATLFIDYGNGFSIQQTQTIDANNYAAFKNLFIDPSKVPNTGVKTVSFTVGDL